MSSCSLRGALYYCLLYPDEIATLEYITIRLVFRLSLYLLLSLFFKGLLMGLWRKSGACVSGS
ncbi:uncharacterized protein BO96DRAFT_411346 [Aspergillus niger CBS 101883]|uniref:uncharacterized protein n=1 Tax=Aspergillus lacticoffeatus (strain CBS 101883) TaxID=1450533 RepID=UPI000D7FFBCB|nr:uncharacterized protein BO96DRAFT_411346 [Aspergillus niger CBS 101883]PYH57656.1 hypothetical protein BO96DRAFT_411346 [Aspergillus niger CBS 101883]